MLGGTAVVDRQNPDAALAGEEATGRVVGVQVAADEAAAVEVHQQRRGCRHTGRHIGGRRRRRLGWEHSGRGRSALAGVGNPRTARPPRGPPHVPETGAALRRTAATRASTAATSAAPRARGAVRQGAPAARPPGAAGPALAAPRASSARYARSARVRPGSSLRPGRDRSGMGPDGHRRSRDQSGQAALLPLGVLAARRAGAPMLPRPPRLRQGGRGTAMRPGDGTKTAPRRLIPRGASPSRSAAT